MPKVQSFEAKILKHRSLLEKIADEATRFFGSFHFFFANLFAFTFWLLMNTHHIPYLSPVDPYPFNFLTLMVSLEAIFLSVFVLISQNRQAATASLREEIHLQINEIAEKEVTKALQLLVEIHKKVLGAQPSDPELVQMLKSLETTKIQDQIEKQMAPQPLAISDLMTSFSKRFHRQ